MQLSAISFGYTLKSRASERPIHSIQIPRPPENFPFFSILLQGHCRQWQGHHCCRACTWEREGGRGGSEEARNSHRIHVLLSWQASPLPPTPHLSLPLGWVGDRDLRACISIKITHWLGNLPQELIEVKPKSQHLRSKRWPMEHSILFSLSILSFFYFFDQLFSSIPK